MKVTFDFTRGRQNTTWTVCNKKEIIFQITSGQKTIIDTEKEEFKEIARNIIFIFTQGENAERLGLKITKEGEEIISKPKKKKGGTQ